MIRYLRTQPWFVLLLPVFFVLHGFAEHFGFIAFHDTLLLMGTYCLFAAIVYGFSWLFFKNRIKAALITSAWMVFYLFFGAFFDFLRDYAPARFFYKYSVLVPVFMLLLFAFFIYLKRTKHPFYRLTLFLNVLLLVYLVVDVISISWKSINPLTNKLANYDFVQDNHYRIPDTCSRPDIYFLLFDEYAAPGSLKEQFNFQNDIDSFLTAQHFQVQTHSRSNYNFTPFSMSSILNMSYLKGFDYSKGVDRDDVLDCNVMIRENQVIGFLGNNGYDIVNLSMFDLAGHPSAINQSFLPVKAKMLTEGTLIPRLYRDFEWFFVNNKLVSKFFTHTFSFQHIENNARFVKEVKELSATKAAQPRFIYAHFYMPHFPYFFDQNGNRKPDSTVIAELYRPADADKAYLNYVLYVNKEMKQLVSTIQQNTHGKAAIMLLADHGYRHNHPKDHSHLYRNLNAVYLPNQHYGGFYDSISNVNQFRVFFNSLFQQQFPLLKDSSYLLFDKQL